MALSTVAGAARMTSHRGRNAHLSGARRAFARGTTRSTAPERSREGE
jgi:hypothetical protein